MRHKLLLILTTLFAIPVSVYLVGNAVGFFGHAGGVPANLLIDLSSSFQDSHFSWRNLAQGGEADSRMLQAVIPQVQALHPLYIRIDHVFDKYNVVSKSGNQISFNWTNLDQTVSDIVAAGARPFIAISYMPPALSSTGDTVGLPNNWGDWEFITQNLVEHISGRNGLNLQGVYYEVWNEPDLFGNFKLYGAKNYIDLYAHTVSGAARASNINPFKIGGPATTALYENWVTDFLNAVVSRNLRLDFYSWHSYTTNLDKYERDIIDVKSWITETVPGINPRLELAITELGPNSNNDPVYDNGFGGIHALATAAVTEDSVDKIFNFEVKDGPGDKEFWGRWGILTNEKFGSPIAKPRYNALAFLNTMVGERVNVAGEGSWVKAFSKRDGKIIRTFVVNYDTEGKHVEAVPITFENIPVASLSAVRSFHFRRINYGGGIPEDINVATTSASWQTFQLMNPNTASIFEVTLP